LWGGGKRDLGGVNVGDHWGGQRLSSMAKGAEPYGMALGLQEPVSQEFVSSNPTPAL